MAVVENAKTIEYLTDLTKTLIKALLDDSVGVVVTPTAGRTALVLTVEFTHESTKELGRFIGRLGANVDAVRRILIAAGTKHRLSVLVEVIDENGRRI